MTSFKQRTLSVLPIIALRKNTLSESVGKPILPWNSHLIGRYRPLQDQQLKDEGMRKQLQFQSLKTKPIEKGLMLEMHEEVKSSKTKPGCGVMGDEFSSFLYFPFLSCDEHMYLCIMFKKSFWKLLLSHQLSIFAYGSWACLFCPLMVTQRQRVWKCRQSRWIQGELTLSNCLYQNKVIFKLKFHFYQVKWTSYPSI